MVEHFAPRVVAQDLDDPTIGDAPAPALFDHAFEFRAQCLQVRDPLFHVSQLRPCNGVYSLAGLVRLVTETQQVTDGLQGEAKGPGVPDERQAADVLVRKQSLVAFRAGWAV